MGEEVEGEEWDIKLTSFMQNIRFHQKKENEEIFLDAKLASTNDYVRPSVGLSVVYSSSLAEHLWLSGELVSLYTQILSDLIHFYKVRSITDENSHFVIDSVPFREKPSSLKFTFVTFFLSSVFL